MATSTCVWTVRRLRQLTCALPVISILLLPISCGIEALDPLPDTTRTITPACNQEAITINPDLCTIVSENKELLVIHCDPSGVSGLDSDVHEQGARSAAVRSVLKQTGVK
jgi:hypothetical protein